MSSLLVQPGPQRSIQVARVHRAVDALNDQIAFDIKITQWKKPRSSKQNKALWGLAYPTILENLPGWDAEDLHEYFLGEHFGWEVVELFGKKRQRPIRRSSRLNRAEFASYFDFIQRKAAEFGIYIPDPDPLWNIK